jgi:hypothetical protein
VVHQRKECNSARGQEAVFERFEMKPARRPTPGLTPGEEGATKGIHGRPRSYWDESLIAYESEKMPYRGVPTIVTDSPGFANKKS